MDRRRRDSKFHSACFIAAGIVLFLAGATAARAQAIETGLDPAIVQEIEYAEALTEMGLIDLARMVTDRITAPEAKPLIKVLRLKMMIARGEWDRIKAAIAAEPSPDSPEVWAMKVAMANGLFAWGKYPEARGIYESFFKKFPGKPPAALNAFFLESAYTYAQMLIMMGLDEEAIAAYETALRADVPRHVQRQIRVETVELMLKTAESAPPAKRKAAFQKAEKTCTEILWVVDDVWFGKAIVLMAHMRLMDGDFAGAQKLIDTYMPKLRDMDRSLREEGDRDGLARMSPMTQCHYLLGVMMHDAAEKLIAAGAEANREQIVKYLAGAEMPGKGRSHGALQHLVQVFVGAPNTVWAPDAGVRVRRIEEILKGPPFNARIKIAVTPELMAKVESLQFQNARVLFNSRQFDQAIEAYLQVLNLYPESENALAALAELAQSYVEAENALYASMVTRYLGERFSGHSTLMAAGGDQLLRQALYYGEHNWFEQQNEAYDLFFNLYTNHSAAAIELFRFAERKFRKDDAAGALPYYLRIKENYPSAPLWSDAVNRLAQCYNAAGDHVKEVKTLQELAETLSKQPRPGHALVNAWYREILAYQQLGSNYVVNAFNRLVRLGNMLADDAQRAKYEETEKDRESNREILQGVLYNKAIQFNRLPPTAGATEESRRMQAIRTLEDLLTRFPRSKLAPSALSQIGTLWTVLDKADEAQKVLQRLQKDFPESSEAKNALFMLGMNLLKMGRRQHAVRVFKEMFTAGGTYSDSQILMAGVELLAEREYDMALEAFDRVLSSSKERSLVEPGMMAKGKALIEKKAYAEGAKVLESALQTYKRSGHTIEACLYLSRAYSEMGAALADETERVVTFNKAIEAMNRARQFEQEGAGRARLDIELARIHQRRAQAEEQYGNAAKAADYLGRSIATYLNLILMGRMDDAGVREQIEIAYRDALPLMARMERWQDVLDTGNAYVQAFRSGGRFDTDVGGWITRARVALAGRERPPDAGETPPPESPASAPEGDAAGASKRPAEGAGVADAPTP